MLLSLSPPVAPSSVCIRLVFIILIASLKENKATQPAHETRKRTLGRFRRWHARPHQRDRRGTEMVRETPPINPSGCGPDVIDHGYSDSALHSPSIRSCHWPVPFVIESDSRVAISTVSGFRPLVRAVRIQTTRGRACLLADPSQTRG
jgi:hypothetical protein